MRKGEETRNEFLQIAERLFCAQGYEETSIQNILDAAHGSKGGFYHHFVSKEDVLRQLCERRAASSAERTAQEIADGQPAPLDQLSLVLGRAMPIHREDLSFMCMMMPILDRKEGMTVRVAFQEAMIEAYLPLLQKAVQRCVDESLIFPVSPDVEKPVLILLQFCWAEAAAHLISDARGGNLTDAGILLDILTVYRKSVEALLNTPYGFIDLMPLSDWTAFAEEACRRMFVSAKTSRWG